MDKVDLMHLWKYLAQIDSQPGFQCKCGTIILWSDDNLVDSVAWICPRCKTRFGDV